MEIKNRKNHQGQAMSRRKGGRGVVMVENSLDEMKERGKGEK